MHSNFEGLRHTAERSPPAAFVQRVTRLYQESRRTGQEAFTRRVQEKLGHVSPFLQKKIDALSSHTSSWGKENLRAWPTSSVRHLALVLGTQLRRVTGPAFRELASCAMPRSRADFLAMTRCPHCSRTGLTLLTSSTREQLSPRFLENVKSLLPSSYVPELTNVRSELVLLRWNSIHNSHSPQCTIPQSFTFYDAPTNGIVRYNSTSRA